MEPLHILFVTGDLNYKEINAYLLNLLRELRGRGHRITLTGQEGVLRTEFERHGVEVLLHPFLARRIIDPFRFWRLTRELRALEPAIDCVHAIGPTLRPGAALARKLDVPMVATVHRLPRTGRLSFDARVVRAVITFGQDLRQDLINHHGAPRDRVHVVQNAVDVERGREAVAHFARADGALPIVGSIGELIPGQGYENLIAAAAELIGEGRTLHTFIVGQGPGDSDLWEIIRRLDMTSHVTLATTVANVYQVLPTFDVYCQPLTESGLGQGLLDAMACARPIVATGVGNIYDLIQDEVTGLIVPANDRRSLAAGIARLLDDEEFRTRVGRNAQELVEKEYHLGTMTKVTEKLYRDAVAV